MSTSTIVPLMNHPSKKLVATALCLAVLGACSDDEGMAILDTGGGDIADTTSPGNSDTGLSSDALADTASDTLVPADTAGPLDTSSPADTTPSDIQSEVIETQICDAGTYICDNLTTRRRCAEDGKSYLEPESCEADESCRNGICQPRCPNDPKFGAYVGCEFWATDLPNYPDPTLNPTPENLPWAIVISNPGNLEVRVGFEMPPLFTYTPADDLVPAGESRVFELPNINVQGTSRMPKGVHVVATGPVLAHQFNPWDNRFSNDASMLLPDPLLGVDYVVLSWETSPLDLFQLPGFPPGNNQNGYFTIIAAYDNTSVTITVTAPVRASGSIPELSPGQTYSATLKRGDVLSIQTDQKTLTGKGDLSGTTITATKPIAVFGGHEEAVVGDPVPSTGGEGGPTTTAPCCADHLEEQMLPVPLLSNRYFAVKSPPRGTVQIENDFWRIQAAEPNVTITTNPPIAGANGVTLANKGDFVQVKANISFEVLGTGRLQIGQYLSSRDTTEDFTGDASLVLMVPEARYRKDYAFMVPERYERLRLAIVKPQGATVSVDGNIVQAQNFSPIAQSGFEAGYYDVTPGYHVAGSTSRFGLFVYGYNNAVSFSYIGGLAGPGE